MRITESQLRRIVREEARRLLEAPRGPGRIPLHQLAHLPAARRRAASVAKRMAPKDTALRRPRIGGRRNLAPLTKAPPGADTLLVYTDHRNRRGEPTGEMHFYVGTEDDVSGFVADGGIGDVVPVEIDGDWEAEANGGPSPVAMWLKRNPTVRLVMDQQVELGDETMTSAEYIRMKMDDMDPDWDQSAWDRGDY